MVDNLSIPEDYNIFLRELKERIRNAQVRAAISVNRELVLLYWQIGQDILNRQQQQGWGAKVIDSLAADLQKAFPEMKGFSSRNLKYMRSFAETYADFEFVQEVLAQITWYHNIALMEKVKLPDSIRRVRRLRTIPKFHLKSHSDAPYKILTKDYYTINVMFVYQTIAIGCVAVKLSICS